MANTKDRGTTTSTGRLGEPEEIDDTMLCDYEACTCEEAPVARGGQRFCSDACADMSAEADENADVAGEDAGEETCMCGHAECEASVTAGAGEERGTGKQPRTPPGRG